MRFLYEFINPRLTAILCAGILAGTCWIVLRQPPVSDFIGYWAGARVFLEGGNPYNQALLFEVQDGLGITNPTLNFWYPPWALCLFLPLSLMDFWTARIVWTCLEAILLLMAIHWLWIALGGRQSEWITAFLVMILYVPTIQTLLSGQVLPFVLIGIVGFVRAARQNKVLLAGLFSVLIACKPHIVYAFWISLLCFCIRNRKAKLLVSVAACIAITTFMLFLYNPSALSGMVKAVFDPEKFRWITTTPGMSIRMLFGLDNIWIQILPTILGSLFVILFWDHREPFSWIGKLPPMLLLSTATATYLWIHDFLILLPVLIQIIIWLNVKPHNRWLLIAILAALNILILVIDRSNYPYLAWFFSPALAIVYFISRRANNRIGSLSGSQPSQAIGA